MNQIASSILISNVILDQLWVRAHLIPPRSKSITFQAKIRCKQLPLFEATLNEKLMDSIRGSLQRRVNRPTFGSEIARKQFGNLIYQWHHSLNSLLIHFLFLFFIFLFLLTLFLIFIFIFYPFIFCLSYFFHFSFLFQGVI